MPKIAACSMHQGQAMVVDQLKYWPRMPRGAHRRFRSCGLEVNGGFAIEEDESIQKEGLAKSAQTGVTHEGRT